MTYGFLGPPFTSPTCLEARRPAEIPPKAPPKWRLHRVVQAKVRAVLDRCLSDGVEPSVPMAEAAARAAGCNFQPLSGSLESSAQYQQRFQIFGRMDSKVIAHRPKSFKAFAFIDPRVLLGKRLRPFHDRMPTHQFKVVHQVLQDIDPPKWWLAEEGLRRNKSCLTGVVVHEAARQTMRARLHVVLSGKRERGSKVEVVMWQRWHVAPLCPIESR